MTIFNYTVNYIDVAIVALIVIFAAVGCRRGLLVNVLNFIRWSVGLFLCFFASSKLTPFVYNSYVRPYALENIQQKIVTSSNVDEIMKNLEKVTAELPDYISKFIDVSAIKLSSDDMAVSILENVFEPTLISLTKAAIFIAVFALFFLITGIVILTVQRRNRKKDKEGNSKLRKADRALGFVLGVFKGAVVVLAVCAVIAFASEVLEDAGKTVEFFEYAKTSALLEYISEINPFNAVTEGII